MSDLTYYAIGDIHGEADKLRTLHSAILDRIAFEKASARIVHLGDYIDRGPDSKGVIDQLIALRARCERQTGSIFVPMGDEMYYRYQRSLIEQAIDTVSALLGRPATSHGAERASAETPR